MHKTPNTSASCYPPNLVFQQCRWTTRLSVAQETGEDWEATWKNTHPPIPLDLFKVINTVTNHKHHCFPLPQSVHARPFSSLQMCSDTYPSELTKSRITASWLIYISILGIYSSWVPLNFIFVNFGQNHITKNHVTCWHVFYRPREQGERGRLLDTHPPTCHVMPSKS